MPVTTARLAVALAFFAAATGSVLAAEKRYDTGASDTEIKVGNIMPYSGPASAYGIIGKTEAAYFKKINAEGGINGRKINFISYDDAYSKATRCCSSSTRSARRRTRRSTNT
jgi:ABC-type branched-subunit amino acid transport system substrate-binding protein